MSKRIAGPEIERLIQLLAKVPGLMGPLADAMHEAHEKVRICTVCGNADTFEPCTICADPRRDDAILIVVEDVADLWALERASIINARYHVLGGRLSPLDGIGPDDLNIGALVNRVAQGATKEVIIAVNATVEGQTTAHYITDQLAGFDVKVTRLAHGVPVGGELDYLDDGTLSAALRARTVL
jgi:recombination protein RecR